MIDRSVTRQLLPKEPAANAMYVGTRTSSGPCVEVKTLHHKTRLQPRLDLIRHSPAGFDWANGSASGSAQLALALLAHATGDDGFALEHYQVFKHEIISRLPKFRWELSGNQMLQMLRFVSSDFESPGLAGLPGESHRFVITAKGTRRNVRKSAKRALLNLLGSQQLPRRRIHQLEIEVSIISSCQSDGDFADET